MSRITYFNDPRRPSPSSGTSEGPRGVADVRNCGLELGLDDQVRHPGHPGAAKGPGMSRITCFIDPSMTKSAFLDIQRPWTGHGCPGSRT